MHGTADPVTRAGFLLFSILLSLELTTPFDLGWEESTKHHLHGLHGHYKGFCESLWLSTQTERIHFPPFLFLFSFFPLFFRS